MSNKAFLKNIVCIGRRNEAKQVYELACLISGEKRSFQTFWTDTIVPLNHAETALHLRKRVSRLRNPGAKPPRQAFKLQKQFIDESGHRSYERINDPRLDLINSDVHIGAVDVINARILVQDLISALYAEQKAPNRIFRRLAIQGENKKLLERFWDQRYSTKDLVDYNSAKCDFERAVRLIDPLSLHSASQHELEKRLKENAKSTGQRRRAVDRLNQLLKFIGREKDRLNKLKGDFNTIRSVTYPELKEILKYVESKRMRLLIRSLFASGLRIGEAAALTPVDYPRKYKSSKLSLTHQIHR